MPNFSNIFGSGYKVIDLFSHINQSSCFKQYFKFSRIHWKARDRPKERCDDINKKPNVLMCLEKYIRNKIGCYVPQLNMNPNGLIPCGNKTQWQELVILYEKLTNMESETRMHNLTGCLSSCEKESFVMLVCFVLREISSVSSSFVG